MAVFQNPVLTDGWWVVKGADNDWGRGLGLLTDGWWFPECLPLDIVRFNLAVGMTPQFGINIMDQLQLKLGIVITALNLNAEIDREKDLSVSINKEEEIEVNITKEIELEVEG